MAFIKNQRTISVLGSTGSIGRQSLEVITALNLSVGALAANTSVELLEEQARLFHPQLVAASDPDAAAQLKLRLADTSIRVVGGQEGMLEAATLPQSDTVLVALVGIAGLIPTLAAIDAGKRIALANKETLVCAGELVMDRAQEKGVRILPVDSEHSALFQCLEGNRPEDVKRLILTASGGPFWGKTRDELADVTPDQALNHPNWSMGPKVTIDSATLMNKGLEYIEAMRLYRMPAEKISVVIQRESIIHSMVEYRDGAVLAQLGVPDMRLPIQYALTWPERQDGPVDSLDLFTCGPLHFAAPDPEAFPCLSLAVQAAREGGTATASLNGANEVAVARFLNGEIGFNDIPELVEKALSHAAVTPASSLDAIFAADAEARRIAAG